MMEAKINKIGFEEIEFVDERNTPCILTEKVVSNEVLFGVKDKEMLLNREHIKEIVQHLCYWLEVGSFDYLKDDQ
jgi:hypothetical protein